MMERFSRRSRMRANDPMPKYVGSNTLLGDLEWNATLPQGELVDSIPKLKDEVDVKRFDSGVVLLTYLPES
jgi:hypothetical protein